MASSVSRASKRLRLTSSATPRQWICQDCLQKRSFATNVVHWQQQQQTSTTPNSSDKATHFGFQNVSESSKASRVGAVFSSVASTYDTMNDLMSLGIHRLWKDYFVRSLNPGIPISSQTSAGTSEGQKILDIAGGTGDIAFRLLDHATHINGDSKTSVIISDINADMLEEGKKRFSNTNYRSSDRVSFLEANAEDLNTIEDGSIDLYTVAFGIRNFTHKDQALREAYRVLKPGGVFACLEFTPQLSNPLLNAIYKRWSFGAIPLIGQVVAADRDSYQYLVESIERFPTQQQFARMIKDAGFLVPGEDPNDEGDGKGWVDLTAGIAAVHKGVKPV